MEYLSEAFKELKILDEDVFDLDKEGLEDLRDFQDEAEEEVIDVYDPEAETEEELEDSYVGKVILDCSVCHTDIYKDKEDVIIDEETQLANVGEECPYCFSIDGFKVIGEVKPFVETELETEDDVDVSVDGEKVEVEEEDESLRRKRIRESISKMHKKALVEKPVYGLEPRYDARKSFYGKAQVDTGDKGDKNKLYSYNTLVAEIKDGKPVVYGTYSATTLRHIKDWLKQNGFRADTSKQIMADYGVKDEACTGKKSKKFIKMNEDWGNQIYEIAESVIRQIGEQKEISWDEFESFLDTAILDMFNLSQDEFDELIKSELSIIVDGKKKYYYDIDSDVRDILSMRGFETTYETGNEYGLRLVERFGRKSKKSVKESVSYSKYDLYNALEYMYGFNKKEANDWIKKASDKMKQSVVDGWKGNAKKSALTDSLKNESLKEGWRGTDLEIVSHGSWGDPDLVYHDNEDEEDYVFNYWDIENGLWDMFLDETGHKDSESDDPEVEAEFDKYVQDNHGWYLSDVIAGGYFDEGSYSWHDRYKRESLKKRIRESCSINQCQKWVDYDMKKYKRISDDTMEKIKSSGYSVVKDQYGDYEVIADRKDESCGKKKSRKMKESIEDITIDTGDQEISVSARDKEKKSDGEMIAPLSDEMKTDIEMNSDAENGEDVDVEMDEFSEEDFDELGESYLKKVYENVNSYKTTSVKEKKNKLYLEGVIKFSSGKEKKTSFVFEAKTIDKNGHAKFLGENLQISRGHKAFKLSGTISDRKFISESLNYNYRAKNGNSSQRVYGTVRTNKK